MMKKIVSFIFALLITVSIPFVCPLCVGRAELPNRYTYVHHITADLQINAGTASCYGDGQGKNNDTTTVLIVLLQRRASDSDPWSSYKRWKTTATGTNEASISQSCSVASGYYYRVLTRCQIKDSGGSVLETVYQSSPIIWY